MCETSKKWNKANPGKVAEKDMKWRKENPVKVAEKDMKWRKENKDYAKNRKKSDPLFKFTCNIRRLTIQAFKNNSVKKSDKTNNIIGCTFKQAYEHIESLFTDGMSWSNHGTGNGKWNIDHFIPISSAKNEADVLRLSKISNLRPLWYEDNMLKFNNMPYKIVIKDNKTFSIIPFLESDLKYIMHLYYKFKNRLALFHS